MHCIGAGLARPRLQDDQPVSCMHETCQSAVVQTNPVITKALTSTGGFIVGDTLAQMATGGSEEYDWCASSRICNLTMLALLWL